MSLSFDPHHDGGLQLYPELKVMSYHIRGGRSSTVFCLGIILVESGFLGSCNSHPLDLFDLASDHLVPHP